MQTRKLQILESIISEDQINKVINDAHVLTIDTTDAEHGAANLINADQLGGIAANEYALKSDTTKVAKINFSNVLYANNWSEVSPYSQVITVEGITSDDRPYIFVDLSAATEDMVDSIEAEWAKVKYALTSENTITFYCIKEAPAIDISIEGEVVKMDANYISAKGVKF